MVLSAGSLRALAEATAKLEADAAAKGQTVIQHVLQLVKETVSVFDENPESQAARDRFVNACAARQMPSGKKWTTAQAKQGAEVRAQPLPAAAECPDAQFPPRPRTAWSAPPWTRWGATSRRRWTPRG